MITPCMLSRFRLPHGPVIYRWGGRRQLACARRTLTSSRSLGQGEKLTVKVGGNGFVNLTLHQPKRPSASNNILIHLPPGPAVDEGLPDVTFDLKKISTYFPDATIVNVDYRLQPRNQQADLDFRFPSPIHDVTAAIDQILGRALGNQEKPVKPKICLYGSHIGAALAVTLALTNPNEIHAVAVRDPLVDWVSLDEIANQHGNQRKSTARKTGLREAQVDAAKALIKLRTSLFRSPSGYFDPFASPTLFLRAPGQDTPLTKTAAPVDPPFEHIEGAPMRYGEEDDEVGIIQYNRDDYGPYDDDWHSVETREIRNKEYRIEDTIDEEKAIGAATGMGENDTNSTTRQTVDLAKGPVRRKVLRRWPPVAMPEDVLLPHMGIFLTKPLGAALQESEGPPKSTPVTYLQGQELTELLRRACFWGREKSFAEERVINTSFEHNSTSTQQEQKIMDWLDAKMRII